LKQYFNLQLVEFQLRFFPAISLCAFFEKRLQFSRLSAARAAIQSAERAVASFNKTASFFSRGSASFTRAAFLLPEVALCYTLASSRALVPYGSQASAVGALLKFNREELYSCFIGRLLAGFNSMSFYETEFFKKSRLTSVATARVLSTGASPSAYVLDIIKTFFLFLINSRVLLFVNFELYVRLTFWERVCLLGIKHRLRFFRNSFSTIFFLNEFVDLAYLAFRNKNLDILLPYINRILKTLVIWDHKKFILFLFSFISEQMSPMFAEWGVIGLKILIKGKIGVGGNSRKRSLSLFLGKPTIAHYDNNVYSYNGIIKTNTGALGFRA
jgi:hypothetical protein